MGMQTLKFLVCIFRFFLYIDILVANHAATILTSVMHKFLLMLCKYEFRNECAGIIRGSQHMSNLSIPLEDRRDG